LVVEYGNDALERYGYMHTGGTIDRDVPLIPN
jgi:hypothetical protein